MTDEEIIEGLARENEEALLCLQMRYGVYCRSIALSLLRSEEEAELCLNDLWLSLWQRGEHIGNLKAYLAKSVRNLALKRIEKRTAQKRSGHTALLDELSECIPDPLREKELESWVLREVLQSFVQGLSPKERHAFLGRYWYGHSIAELSQELGWREARLTSLLFRLRKRLKIALEKEGIDP